MDKLYFFRHMINGSVVISKTPKLDNSHLSQVGAHRSGIVLRRDHWIPFLQLESKSLNLNSLYDNIVTQYAYPLPKVRYPLPIKNVKWTIPDTIKNTIVKLHSALGDNNHEITMRWERLDFQKIVEWPGTISHDKLSLVKNSIQLPNQIKDIKTFVPKTKLEY